MSGRNAVIVGGGLGGLAAALRLSMRGWRVTVCERNETFGGKMSEWRPDGFRFDTGPSLITLPWIFEELFQEAGHSLDEHLELLPLHPAARYVFADGVRFDYSTVLNEWLPTLKQLHRADAQGFLQYFELGARIYELSKDTFLRRPVMAPLDGQAVRALRHFPLRHAWGNYHRTVAAHFRDPHLRQLYDRYPTYVGSSPYRSPATLTVIPYIEYAFGGWYIRGGLFRLVEALVAILEERGVALRLGSQVAAIEHAGKRVSGVRLRDGERLAARVVIMNGEPGYTPRLLGESPDAELSVNERSLAGLVFLIGLRRKLPDLAHHNVFFSEDYHGEFRQLFDERRFPEDPTVYINIPSRSDPSCAPEGGDALFLMANAPANNDAWDEEQKAEARRRVFARLRAGGFPDIEKAIAAEMAVTPKWMAERYAMPGGAIYGRPSHGWRRAFFRHPNKDARYKGLYHVGGSAHPGGGTPMVLLSAKIAVELIERHET